MSKEGKSTNKFIVPEKKTIQEMEQETLDFWKERKIFEKSVDQRPEDNLYVFYDGPPFISGLPHYGSLLSSVAKDVIPRYWTMKGKRVERLWGWDAHGLTVENRVQKKLGIENRRDIEKFGLEKFIKECYIYTSETSAEWEWYVDKIGRWVDIQNAYKTLDQSYMESVIWAFKQLYDKDLIYEGVYTSLFCPTCGTPVSDFEIAMDNSYRDAEDASITVKFPITSKGDWKDVTVLAWTTTPWTIPSNRGLVVDEKATYVVVAYEGAKYIAAKELLERVFSDSDKKHEVEKEFLGEELVGLEYEAPYNFFKPNNNDFKIYSFEGMVHMEEGTGVVHSAPGFGMVDTDMGKHYGLTIMLTIDDTGKFVAGTNGKNPFEGLFYKKANDVIREDMTKRNLLFSDSKITHRVPYHDRCNTLLIQRAQNSWFVNIQKLKPDMVKNNEDINWVPDYLKNGRFKEVLETAPDWCISRSRFWATPMPVWQSEDGDKIVVGSFEELEKLSGQKVKDLHRPYIDEITIEKDGKTYRRISEVLDSWFEAGSMPYAQIHYPFENKTKFDKNFPGDFVAEYMPQVRAWFNQMHRLSVAIFNKAPFKNVISTGVMQGSDGRKMSKTYGNYTDPKEVLQNIGGDALRLYMMNSPVMIGESVNFDDEELRTKLRNVLNPLWNSAKYFFIYAAQHNYKPSVKLLSGEVPKADNVLDKWIIGRLHQTLKEFTENIEAYLVPTAVQPLEDFVDDLSRWYVRRSRARISTGDQKALTVFYYVLVEFSKAAAPVIPFITEKIYHELALGGVEFKESVHLEDYPKYSEKIIKETAEILQNMQEDRNTVTAVLSIRSQNGFPIKMTMPNIKTENKVHFKDIVADEVNVLDVVSEVKPKDLKVYASDGVHVSDELQVNLIDPTETQEVLEDRAKRDIIRKIQGLRKKNGLVVSDKIIATYEKNDINEKAAKSFAKEIKEKVNATSLKPAATFSAKKV